MIPKRAFLETDRRRDAMSSAMSRSSRRSVHATERGSVPFYQKGPCSLLLVIALVRPIVDCDHFLLVIFLTKNYSKGVEQDTSPEKEQNVICTKYAPMRLQPRANKWQKCGTRILNSFRKCIRDLLGYILELLYYFLHPKTAKLILHIPKIPLSRIRMSISFSLSFKISVSIIKK